MAQFLNSYLVVWRESFEAVLVIFLLYTGLARQGIWSKSRNFILTGLVAGLFLSLGFGYAMINFDSVFDSDNAQLLQGIFPLIAAGLMLHMVVWMAKHSSQISGDIRKAVNSENTKTLTWGLLALVAYTITREGFETVVYLYGLSMSQGAAASYSLIGLACLLGIASSVGLMYGISKTTRFVGIKNFFRITNLFLLGAAASMLVSGVNKMIELEYIPSGLNPLWNSSALLGSESLIGKIATQLVGYTPMPSLTLVLAYGAFWAAAVSLLMWNKRGQGAQS
ncbi:FTR1 family iron permease [Bdellovibrio sp. HCB337]|uniref:FTR1 family iron permease n=1 Tax=Bdellovibrio sp. HCB337 TaxID=3394358 RepID=UPI0039A6E062